MGYCMLLCGGLLISDCADQARCPLAIAKYMSEEVDVEFEEHVDPRTTLNAIAKSELLYLYL